MKEIEVPGGKELEVRADLKPLGSLRKKLKPAFFWTGVGLTGASALIAIVTGSLALKKEREYDTLTVDDDWRPVQRSARNLAVTTDVFWALAGTSAALTVLLGVFTDFGKEDRDTLSWHLDPLSIRVSGVF